MIRSANEANENSPLLGNSVINNIQDESPEHSIQGLCDDREDLSEPFQSRSYKRRWWILFAFCWVAIAQSVLWNTWSPLLDAVLISYGWSDSFVALLPALSNGGYVLCAFPLMYVVEVTDLRNGLIIAASLLVFGTASWNIALPTGQSWLIAVGSFFCGITACITMAAPSLLSVIWFPLSERTTATAFAAMSGYAGTGIAFITSPYISGANVTADEVNHRDKLSPDFVAQLKAGILNVVYFDTALAVISFVMVIIYFPPKPPTPPSKSQTKQRENFWQGIKHLFWNPNFWLLNLAYSLPNSAFNSWIPLASVHFRDLGIDEATAGWIGFTSTMGSVVGSVAMSMAMDRVKRRMKMLCIVISVFAVIIFIIIALIQQRFIYIPEQRMAGVLYALCIGAAFCLNGCIPFYYELGCEIAFPVHEGLACSFLTVSNNLCGMFFFLLFLVPQLAADTKWMSWSCVGVCALSGPLLLLMKERFNRLDLETTDDSSDQVIVDDSSDQVIVET